MQSAVLRVTGTGSFIQYGLNHLVENTNAGRRERKEAKLVIDRKITFRVDESFVGPSNPTFAVSGGNERYGTCNNGFTPGKQYLVDAYWGNREWTANSCTATAEVKDTPLNVASLRAWKRGTK